MTSVNGEMFGKAHSATYFEVLLDMLGVLGVPHEKTTGHNSRHSRCDHVFSELGPSPLTSPELLELAIAKPDVEGVEIKNEHA